MRLTLAQAVEYYDMNEPRGEYVLVLEGGVFKSQEADISDPRELAERYMADGIPKMEAVKKAAKELGIPKNEVYKLFNND